MIAGIEKIGAPAVFDIVNADPFFKSAPKVKYNIKKMIKELITNRVHFDANIAAEELDRKMLNVLQTSA